MSHNAPHPGEPAPPQTPHPKPDSLPSHLEKMLGEARMAVWRWDPDLDAGSSSPLMNELWGLLPGQNLQDSTLGFRLIHPDDVERQRALVEGAVARGGSWHNEFRIIRPRDGKIAWLEERAHATRDPATGKVFIDGVTWEVTARKAAERAQGDSELKYQTLFHSIDEGFALWKLLYDADGNPCDALLLESNAGFERLPGQANAVGKTNRQIYPDMENWWFETYRDVLKSGTSARVERFFPPMDRWFEAHISALGPSFPDQVVVVFTDITERRKAAEMLRESEARKDFLVRLEDTLRPLESAAAIQAAAACLLGKRLGVDRVFYAELDEAQGMAVIPEGHRPEGLPDITGSYPMEIFEDALRPLRKGKVLDIGDARAEPGQPPRAIAAFHQLGVVSLLAAPLMKEGRLRWALCAAHSEPREWTEAEIALVRETAERTWAAVIRAQAEEDLRASEQKYHALFDSIDEGFCLLQMYFDEAGRPVDFEYLETNPAFVRHAGMPMQGRRIKELFPQFEQVWLDQYGDVALTGRLARVESQVGGLGNQWFQTTAFRHGPAENRQVAVVFTNVTDRKKAEQDLVDFNARLEMQVRARTEQLRESRDLLQSLLDTSLVGMAYMTAVRDDAGRVTDFVLRMVNKELERETGRDDLVGRYYAQEYPGLRTSGLFDLMVRVLETGKPDGKEYFYPHDGFNKWFSSMFVRFEDGLVATNLDITRQKKVEADLKNALAVLELENKIHAYAEEIGQMGTWTWNTASNAFSYSDNLYRLFGLEPGAIKPALESMLGFVHPDDVERVKFSAGELRRNGERNVVLEYRVIRRDGVVRHFANRVQKVADLGTGHLLVGITEDITERKKVDERSRRLRVERLALEERQRLALLAATLNTQENERRRISENLHNGIGQMLYGIQLNLNLLDLKPGDAWQPRHAEQQARTTRLLSEAINESRRVSHELMPNVLEDFGLKTAVEDICKQFHGKLNVDCRYSDLPGEIPQYISIALYRALQELMTNVVKHAEASGVKIHLRHTGSAYELEVIDDGIGFDLAKQPGGIGLKTLREKMALLKGEFDANSGEAGTTIRLRIPDVVLEET